MDYSDNFRNFFIVATILTIGTMMFVKIGTIDLHAIWATGVVLVPAVIVMGYLGQTIVDISRDFLDKNGASRYQNVEVKLPDFENSPFNVESKDNFKMEDKNEIYM